MDIPNYTLFPQVTGFKENPNRKDMIGITLKHGNSAITWYTLIDDALKLQFYIKNDTWYLQMREIEGKALAVGIDNAQIKISNGLRSAYSIWKISCTNDELLLKNFQVLEQEEILQKIRKVVGDKAYNKAIRKTKIDFPTLQYNTMQGTSTSCKSILKNHSRLFILLGITLVSIPTIYLSLHFTNWFNEILDRMQKSKVAGLQTIASVEITFTFLFVATVVLFSAILLYCQWCFQNREAEPVKPIFDGHSTDSTVPRTV